MEPIAPCGVDCGSCHAFGRDCNGCREVAGKVAWLGIIGEEICPLYKCPVIDRGLESCGQCGEVPCKQFYDLRDPSIPMEEHIAEIGRRVKRLGR